MCQTISFVPCNRWMMNRFSSWCFAAAFCLLAWAAHAVVFNPPMLFSTGSTSAVIDLGTATGGSGASSAKVTIGAGGVPAGSTIVVQVTPTNPAATISVTDTAVNTYVRQNRVFYDSGVLVTAAYICQNCLALIPGNTITFTVSVGNSILSALAIKTTQATSLDLNTSPINSGASKITNPTITSGTPSTAGEIFVGMIGFVTVSPTSTMVLATGGWQQPPDFASTGFTQSQGGGWIKNAGTSPQTYNPTLSANNFVGAMLFSFKL